MNPRMLLKVIVLLVAVAIIGGCAANTKQNTDPDKIQVITSFYPLYDFANKIGGEHVSVVNLIATGVEPHDWTPKPQDMIVATEAEVFIYNGLGLEGWVDPFLKGLDDKKERVIVEASKGIAPIHGFHDADEHDHDHGLYDPHIWLSPLQAIKMAENIKDGLIQADAAHAADYEAGYSGLKQDLEALHEEYLEAMAQTKRKDIVVSHQAYGYLARDYGLAQVPVMGLSPESEPTAKEMQRIIEYIRDNQIKYILFEEFASPQLAKILAEEAGVETLVFHPLEGLTEEQLRAGEDYVSIMRSNLETLKKALN